MTTQELDDDGNNVVTRNEWKKCIPARVCQVLGKVYGRAWKACVQQCAEACVRACVAGVC